MTSAELPNPAQQELSPSEDVAQSLALVFQRLEFLAGARRRGWIQSWGTVLDAEIDRFRTLDLSISHQLGGQDIDYNLNDIETAALQLVNGLKDPNEKRGYSQTNLQNLLTPEVRQAGHALIDVLRVNGIEVEPIGPDGQYDSERMATETEAERAEWHRIYTQNIWGSPDPNPDVE